MRRKPRAIRRQRAIDRHHRRQSKAVRKANRRRSKRAVRAFKRDTANQIARMTKLALLSADTRVRYARKQMVAPVLLPTPPKRFLPTWQETFELRKKAA